MTDKTENVDSTTIGLLYSAPPHRQLVYKSDSGRIAQYNKQTNRPGTKPKLPETPRTRERAPAARLAARLVARHAARPHCASCWFASRRRRQRATSVRSASTNQRAALIQ